MVWYLLSGSIFCFLFIELLRKNTPVNIPDANIYMAGFMGFLTGLFLAFVVEMLLAVGHIIGGLF